MTRSIQPSIQSRAHDILFLSMAKDTSFDERRRQRELEDQEDRDRVESRKMGTPIAGGNAKGPGKSGDAAIDKLIENFQRVEPLIEQLNNLYNQFFAGVERRPPIERRKQLDQLMMSLQLSNKPTPAYQFRFNTLYTSYITHRERWDKLVK